MEGSFPDSRAYAKTSREDVALRAGKKRIAYFEVAT